MNYKLIAVIVGTTQLLLGCDEIGSGSKSIVSANQQIYTPAVRNGSNTSYSEVASANGYTAYLGNPDGTVSEVRVRMDEDREILYVSKDGGAEVEYDTVQHRVSDGSSYVYGRWRNAEGDTFYIQSWNDDGHSYVDSSESGTSNYARGWGGLQSAPEDLPDSANYSGGFYTQGDITSSGNMTLNVDFANGDLGGGITNGRAGSAAFTGTIDGSVSGSRVSGAATIEGDATGTLDLAGAAYGANANQISGGIVGTLTVGEDDFATGGRFHTYQDNQIAN